MAESGNFFSSIFGSKNERMVKSLLPIVAAVNALEPAFQTLSDAELRAKSDEFRARLAKGETVNDIQAEAFAACREASKRTLGLRHFDMQVLGGAVLHKGMIAEMVTGEGKTLVATLAVYLNALKHNVHVVTVNDYLAKRDADWMRPVYEALGMTVGAIQSQMMSAERIPIYRGDVVYGTNSEFGFDYLRDNMKVRGEDQCQGGIAGLHFAVIDEVDSILIDEARTPLIISGPAEEERGLYEEADRVARRLKPVEDFEIKLKEQQCVLSEEGLEKAERLAGTSFFEGAVTDWPHLLEQALRAHHIYQLDKDYVVVDGEVIIVDEFTGRLMQGRRWSDGLHQAVEAKEQITVREENQTLATITYQNFFKLYRKLGGMTGTAATEAAEFWKIYHLEVVTIPTNKPLIRGSGDDRIYRTEKEKFDAVVNEIIEVHKTGRPILVGTTSIEKSERLSGMLSRKGVEHAVLNAKQHEREAQIVAEAGQMAKVTIATNMAGRGTDILLGQGVAQIGGLHILGTERHESRRIDNQLRGRAGRQGDPGSSQFFLSLEDDLMKIFASEWVANFLGKLGMSDGQDITHPMVTKAITRAQKKVEERNFEIRKNLLEYDEVMDIQRKEVYGLRQDVLDGKEARQQQVIEDMSRAVVDRHVDEAYGKRKDTPEDRHDPKEVAAWFRRHFAVDVDDAVAGPGPEEAKQNLAKIAVDRWRRREQEIGAADMRRLERFLLLNSIDSKWKDHLRAMDGLRTGVGIRGYGQMDPKVEYKVEGHSMFSQMIWSIREEVTDLLFKVRLRTEDEAALAERWGSQEPQAPPPPPPATTHTHSHSTGLSGHGGPGMKDLNQSAPAKDAGKAYGEAREGKPVGSTGGPKAPIKRNEPKVGRNDPCPCGSGKKYKKCHGEAA